MGQSLHAANHNAVRTTNVARPIWEAEQTASTTWSGIVRRADVPGRTGLRDRQAAAGTISSAALLPSLNCSTERNEIAAAAITMKAGLSSFSVR